MEAFMMEEGMAPFRFRTPLLRSGVPLCGGAAARLLLCRVADPHQTGCVVARLQREGRPCPMCQRPNLETHPDLYLRRKVRELRVRCPYTAGGCGWEGELGNRDAHTDSCLKSRGTAATAHSLPYERLQRSTEEVARGSQWPAPAAVAWGRCTGTSSPST